ncbi:MAG TPA: bifunctional histidinol-phosphatase/imidazoleglycerol-phosphate dehydratase HisB [Steroidobacteraceae bacterium]|nr:bifunctional histidinol-phosphatase/imidazoleglycerol-phosphate dehydratase HisB [Steroidobacteraceae bacterium]
MSAAAPAAPRPTLFVDRDGTLIEEPPDEQVDRLDKIRLMPGVIPALLTLAQDGLRLVMVTNQDGLGTASLPQDAFDRTHRFTLELFASQGIVFDAVFVCPHFARDECACRKPKLGLVQEYLQRHPIDAARSFMVGDRDTDLQFARNLGVQGLRVRLGGDQQETWQSVARRIHSAGRSARIERTTKETEVTVQVDLSREGPSSVRTGIGFFDHMLEQVAKHGGFALALECKGDLHVDEHHTVEDCALALGRALRQALGDKGGIGRYGFVLPMDEAEAQVSLDLSGRPYFVWQGRFSRERVGDMPTELVPHFFRSLAEALGAALHLRVSGENTHHMIESCFKGLGRTLRQAVRREGSELPSTKGTL